MNADFEVILSDFGFCVPCNPEGHSEQVVGIGSPEYNPPEVMDGDKIGSLFPIDVFQSGVVLFMMLFNSRPFQSSHSSDPYYRLFLEDQTAFWHIFRETAVSSACRELLQALLRQDPECRIDLEGIEKHPWLQTGEELGTQLV